MKVCTVLVLDRGLVMDAVFSEIIPAEGGGGTGTVTSVSVTTANGVSGSVANATTTPAITITLGAITPTTVNGNTISSGTGTLALSTYTLTMTGTASLQGTNTGDQTISLTGDVTGSGTTTFAATIAAGSVTYAKMQDVSAASKLLGRGDSGSGDVQEITLGSSLTMVGTTLSASAAGGADPRSAVYNPFTPSGDDDEFDNGSFTGWTAVNSGSHNPTITEANDVVSMLFPGSDATGELHAYMKSRSMAAGTASIETFFRGYGRAQNFNICGLILADGVTYGAGSQFVIYHSPQEVNALRWGSFTNYSTLGTAGSVSAQSNAPHGDLGLRLVYTAANTFRGYVSIDGISWIDFTGAISRTLTPTYAGFFATTWSGTQQFIWSWRYARFAS